MNSQKLLSVWEANWNRTPCEQAVALVAGMQSLSYDSAANLLIGQRDRLLFDIQTQLFGTQLALITNCPACQEVSELDLTTSDLQLDLPQDEWYEVHFDTEAIYWRLPRSVDLLPLKHLSPDDARRHLVLGLLRTSSFTIENLPDDLIDMISGCMSERDPQANIELETTCANCQFEWQQSLDIVSVLWTNLNGWARRVLGEIHVLAKAYGWTEAETLTLSPIRRQIYLSMITG